METKNKQKRDAKTSNKKKRGVEIKSKQKRFVEFRKKDIKTRIKWKKFTRSRKFI